MVGLLGRVVDEWLGGAAVEGAGESDGRGGETLSRGRVQLETMIHKLLKGARHGGPSAGALVGGGEDSAAAGLGLELDGEEGPKHAGDG